MALASIPAKCKIVHFYSTVDLANELDKEQSDGKAWRKALARLDLVMLNFLPFSQAGGALLFHLLSKFT